MEARRSGILLIKIPHIDKRLSHERYLALFLKTKLLTFLPQLSILSSFVMSLSESEIPLNLRYICLLDSFSTAAKRPTSLAILEIRAPSLISCIAPYLKGLSLLPTSHTLQFRRSGKKPKALHRSSMVAVAVILRTWFASA